MALSDPELGTSWRIHAVLPRTRANGPGLRYAIWSQGCTLACPGCFNPETHRSGAPGSGRLVADVAAAVLAEPDIDGVTLTGGEPLEQPAAVTAFCREIRVRSGLGIVILTGFSRSEIEGDPARMTAVETADMVIAGRYNARQHLGAGLRGSANKEYWALTGRYRAEDFSSVPEVEIIVAPDGAMTVTGLPEGEVA